jgi:hypothetical protein
MTTENIKNLWKFQQLVRADTQFKTAEDNMRNLKNSIEDAVYRAKEAEELTAEEFQEYKEMEQLLYRVKKFVQDQESKISSRKCKLGYELEKVLGSDEL